MLSEKLASKKFAEQSRAATHPTRNAQGAVSARLCHAFANISADTACGH